METYSHAERKLLFIVYWLMDMPPYPLAEYTPMNNNGSTRVIVILISADCTGPTSLSDCISKIP